MSQPLLNRTVVVTRATEQQGEARRLLESEGACVLDLPALVIGPPDDWGPLDDALEELEDFHWLVVSSANGVHAVEQRLQRRGSGLALILHAPGAPFTWPWHCFCIAQAIISCGPGSDFVWPRQ